MSTTITASAVTTATLNADAIVGTDSSLGITGLADTQGGAVVATGGASSTSGNAGGAASLVGGAPGATGVGGAANVTGAAGGSTSGKGGAANVTAGAGTAGNASGGSVVITAGAKNGSGLDGGIFQRSSLQFYKLGTPATETNTASLTDAQMIAGLLVGTPTSAAAYTVRTGTQLKAALPTDLVAGDSFDLTIINLGASTGRSITLTAATDITIVGDAVVKANADGASQATFTFRFVTGTTFVAYRTA